MNRYPSMASVHSAASLGHMPASRALFAVKTSPGKPYGPTFVAVMNRMWRGSGKKYIIYAVISLCVAILFFVGGALYFGHRNVARLIVLNTEVLGALMIAGGILFTGAFFHFVYKANIASNRWRGNIRFRAEGLCSVAAYNTAYAPDDEGKLATGTYGPLAIKELTRGRPNRSRSRGFLKPMSGYITPRTPLIRAEEDLDQSAFGAGQQTRGDESMRSSIHWMPQRPGPGGMQQEPGRWQQQQQAEMSKGAFKGVQVSEDTVDARKQELNSPSSVVVFPPSSPLPPPPPPPPAFLPPVSRQPVTTTKKTSGSPSPAVASSFQQQQKQQQQQQQQQQKQQKQQQQAKGARPTVRLSYTGSESEL